MTLTMQTLRSSRGNVASLLGLRWAHGAALPAPLDGIISRSIALPPLVLPEFDRPSPEDSNNSGNIGFGFPSFSSGGSMELMAVPKRKVSPHKRGIRNGPKALKPTPVIIRCNLISYLSNFVAEAVVESNCHTSIVAVETGEIPVSEMLPQDEQMDVLALEPLLGATFIARVVFG
ncbi:hypothetical protein L484_015690 [Morus notabilis]|uniref:Large ribosomal subunit protein bL32m n=1 Tax=Morus notabilis TaxID=981085 RepID=W9S0D2_9ROSA|nr:hypothetical protein L484_015690 [Morus notabilis]